LQPLFHITLVSLRSVAPWMVKLSKSVTGVTQVLVIAVDDSVGNRDFTMGCTHFYFSFCAPNCSVDSRFKLTLIPCVSPWGWIPGQASCKLNTCRQGADFTEEIGAHFHAQAHISTQPPPPREEARLPRPHENQERSCRVEPSPRRWPQACIRQRRASRLSSRRTVFGRNRFNSLAVPAKSLRQYHEHPYQA